MMVRGSGALVTGAGRRIGRATALALARAGARVVVHYNTSESDARKVVEEITANDGVAVAMQADLRDPDAARSLFDDALDALRECGSDSIQVLINNASVFVPSSLESTDRERWQEDFSVHVDAPLQLCQSFAARLAKGDPGRIVNLLDWRASIPDAAYVSYGISKGALLSLTRTLARSLGPDITVNGVAPGAVLPASGGAANPKELLSQLPIPRMGDVDDVVSTIQFLIGAAYITGAVIPVDGGRHLL